MKQSKVAGRTVRAVERRLSVEHGLRPWRRQGSALDVLILTILSQNTSDVNRDKAYARLREKFPKWEDVLEAPLHDVEQEIRPAGLSKQKSPCIKRVLSEIQGQRGRLSLEFLRARPIDEALSWLVSFKGVGPKMAACVLVFAFGKPVFPVDTHIHRITKRLGWINEKTSADEAHNLLGALIPDDLKYQFHINLIEHGRNTCAAQRPKCSSCVVRQFCAFYEREIKS